MKSRFFKRKHSDNDSLDRLKYAKNTQQENPLMVDPTEQPDLMSQEPLTPSPLPNEIWYMILSFIDNPCDMRSVKLSCKCFKLHMDEIFDYSFRNNLPLWYCFERKQFKECKRLLNSQKVVSIITRNFLVKQPPLVRKEIIYPDYDMVMFLEENILPILKKTVAFSSTIIGRILSRCARSKEILEWASDIALGFNILLGFTEIINSYYLILDDTIFLNLINIILPRFEVIQNTLLGNFLVCYACRIGSLKLLTLLVEKYGAGLTRPDYMPFKYACASRNLPLIHYFFKEGVFPRCSEEINNIFTEACAAGNVNYATFLMQLPQVKLSANYQFPLRIAAKNGRLEMVRVLLDNKANPSVKNQDALICAIESRNIQVVGLIASHPKMPATIWNENVLIRAIETCNTEIVQLLLSFQQLDNHVKSGLLRSIEIGNTDTTELLIAHHRVDKSIEISALLKAIDIRKLDILSLLSTRIDIQCLFSDRIVESLLVFFTAKHEKILQHIFSNQKISIDDFFIEQVSTLSFIPTSIIDLILAHPSVRSNAFVGKPFYNAISSGNTELVKKLLARVNPSHGEYYSLRFAYMAEKYDCARLILNYCLEQDTGLLEEEDDDDKNMDSLERGIINFIGDQYFQNADEKYSFLFHVASKNPALIQQVLVCCIGRCKTLCNGKECFFAKERQLFGTSKEVLKTIKPFCKCDYVSYRLKNF